MRAHAAEAIGTATAKARLAILWVRLEDGTGAGDLRGGWMGVSIVLARCAVDVNALRSW